MLTKADIKTLLKIHRYSLKVRDLVIKFTHCNDITGKLVRDNEENTKIKFQEDYSELIEKHGLTIEDEMFWACVTLNVGTHRIFEVESESDKKLKKYGLEAMEKR